MVIEKQALFNVNKMYVDELTSYIESLKGNIEPPISLNNGVQALRLIEDQNV